MTTTQTLPVLPLRDIVVFPGMVVPLFVGREKSVKALESVVKANNKILLVSQKNGSQDTPTKEDLYRVGTLATVLREAFVLTSRTATMPSSMMSGSLVHDLVLPASCVRTTSPPLACRSLHSIGSVRLAPTGMVESHTMRPPGFGTA